MLTAYNECVLVFTFSGLITVNTAKLEEETEFVIGWTIIGFIITSLILTWAIIIPQLVLMLCAKIKSWIHPPRAAPTLRNTTPTATLPIQQQDNSFLTEERPSDLPQGLLHQATL